MIDNEKGFSLVEIIIAVAIFSLLMVSFGGAYLYGQEATVVSGKRARATLYAREGLEGVRNIKDADFENLIDGNYGLKKENNEWKLLEGNDSWEIFTRNIAILSVEEGKKKITVTVTWQQNMQRDGIISLEGYFTDWTRLAEYVLTVNSSEGGVIISPEESETTHTFGEEVEIIAEANEGYFFDKWIGDTENIGNVDSKETTVVMESDYQITAIFIEEDAPVIETCLDYCNFLGYSEGFCRQNRNRCINNGETYEEEGDNFCSGRGGENTCCCS